MTTTQIRVNNEVLALIEQQYPTGSWTDRLEQLLKCHKTVTSVTPVTQSSHTNVTLLDQDLAKIEALIKKHKLDEASIVNAVQDALYELKQR